MSQPHSLHVHRQASKTIRTVLRQMPNEGYRRNVECVFLSTGTSAFFGRKFVQFCNIKNCVKDTGVFFWLDRLANDC